MVKTLAKVSSPVPIRYLNGIHLNGLQNCTYGDFSYTMPGRALLWIARSNNDNHIIDPDSSSAQTLGGRERSLPGTTESLGLIACWKEGNAYSLHRQSTQCSCGRRRDPMPGAGYFDTQVLMGYSLVAIQELD
jgi:hypothetical protein